MIFTLIFSHIYLYTIIVCVLLTFFNSTDGSGVNPDHHVQCQGKVDNYSSKRHRTQRRTSSRALHRESRILSAILNGFSLSQGERLYLNSIAKIYDMDDLWRQKQLQCTYLLWSGISKGMASVWKCYCSSGGKYYLISE